MCETDLLWKKTAEGLLLSDREGNECALVVSAPGTEDSIAAVDGALVFTRRCLPAEKMCIEIRTRFPAVHMTIPAVCYDGNPWGHDHEYKGWEEEGVPYTFAAHRTILPGAGISLGDNTGFALYGDGFSNFPADAREHRHQMKVFAPCTAPSGSLFLREGRAVHRLIWPETEAPRVLYADGWGEAFYGKMPAQTTFTARFFTGRDAGRQMMHYAWKAAMNARKCPVSGTAEEPGFAQKKTEEELWQLSADYARRLYSEEPDGFTGFSIGFQWIDGQWKKRPNYKYEIGWCGQNASLAVSLMEDYRRTGCRESLDKALAVLDCWLSKGRSSSGLLLTRYDPDDTLIDACNLGTAGCQFLEAYEAARSLGIKRESYLDAAFEICDFAAVRQLPSGQIGMSWNRDGSLHELQGTAGAFLVLPLVRTAQYAAAAGESIPEEKKAKAAVYLRAARKAYDFYFQEFARNSYGTSGALDTCCIDKESAIPLLKGAVYLHEATGEPDYIAKAEEAAWYLSTWQWHQTTAYPADTVLGQLRYDTFGGTAVSTSHHHLDPFALCYIPELVRLSQLTGEPQWRERARAIWDNAAQLVSDGAFQIPPTAVRPAGSCDEGILHTRWGTRGQGSWGAPFTTSQWLVAWPCAFRLEVLRKKVW